MSILSQRTQRHSGTAYEVGCARGRALGQRLDENIERYFQFGPAKHAFVDTRKLTRGALPWLDTLPVRFQEELQGLADGAVLSLQRIAEWSYVENCLVPACSTFLYRHDQDIWIGRNNDIWAPDMWGYMTMRTITARLPTLCFGMEGDTFTGTGLNAAGLWLHYNYLPLPAGNFPATALPPYVWLTNALETCHNLDHVDDCLRSTPRTGGMLLFAVDSRHNQASMYECDCGNHLRIDLQAAWLAGTNHTRFHTPLRLTNTSAGSKQRLERMNSLSGLIPPDCGTKALKNALVAILADNKVEICTPHHGTAFSNLVCMKRQEIWYTCGGYPAASRGNWQNIPWPWPADQ